MTFGNEWGASVRQKPKMVWLSCGYISFVSENDRVYGGWNGETPLPKFGHPLAVSETTIPRIGRNNSRILTRRFGKGVSPNKDCLAEQKQHGSRERFE